MDHCVLEWKSTLKRMTEYTLKRVIQTTSLEWILLPNDVIPNNMTKKRVDSTPLYK